MNNRLLLLIASFICLNFSNIPAEIAALVSENATIVASLPYQITLHFNTDELVRSNQVQNGENCNLFTVQNEGFLMKPGLPMLPAVSRFVVVPPDVGIELVVRADSSRIIPASGPPVVYTEGGAPENPFSLPDINSLYPPQIAEMSDPIVLRGVRMVRVITYPVQYDPSNDCYVHHDRIETELHFTDDEPVNPARVPVRRNRSREFRKCLRALAINSGDVGRDDPDRDAVADYVGHYLIVTHEGCLEYIAPFIEWRRKSGWKVDILSIPDNRSRNPEMIKADIQDRYDDLLDQGIDPFDHILLVGDRSRYAVTEASDWQLEAERGQTDYGVPSHADYLFACLEGNDDFPDVGISRWCAGDQDMLELFTRKTLAYEADPYMDDTSWFTRGGVLSNNWTESWHVSIQTNVRWGVEVLDFLGFDDIRFFEEYEFPSEEIREFETDLLNEGVNLLIGRTHQRRWRTNYDGVNDNVTFPIRLVTNGHGEWPAWSALRTGNGDHLRGPVAATCVWGGPETLGMTITWLEMVRGMLLRDLDLGWMRVYVLTDLPRIVPNFYQGQENRNVKTDFDVYGDPGIQHWKGVPRELEMEHPNLITTETRSVEVNVFDPDDDDNPVSEAQVTLYLPGDMPEFDDEDYAEYDEMIMLTKKTDLDGIVRFMVTDDFALEDEDELFVTVSGRDMKPVFGTIEVGTPNRMVDLAGFTLTEVQGNDDEEVNPGESFTLELSAVNSGSDDLEDVTAEVISLSPWVEIEDEEIEFGDLDSGAYTDGQDEVTVTISASCPDGNSRPAIKPELNVDFSSGDENWRTVLRLNPVAPNFVVAEIVGGNVVDFDEQNLNIEIGNIGGMDSPALTAELISPDIGVEVVRGEANYPAIGSGDSEDIEGDRFRIRNRSFTVPGSQFKLFLVLTNEDQFCDTAHFELQFGESAARNPHPPDEYGYVCFDDSDDDWEWAPVYDWIEISRDADDRDYNGTLIDFEGDAPYDIGEALTIGLDFVMQFYGRKYDEITVATNGFIAMGDQGPNGDYADGESNEYTGITNFNNWPLDRGIGGGVGMIAPFWDDFSLTDESGVYYYQDEEEHRLIVEWYQMRHSSGGNQRFTFQAILYDCDFWSTPSGDQQIIFQYRSIDNIRDVREGSTPWVNDTPYASVGISSPEGIGLSYTWNNNYHVSSAPLANGRAIKFTTTLQYSQIGALTGHVVDADNDEPISDVEVRTNHGISSLTDSAGFYNVDPTIAGTPFDLTFSRQGYNDSTVSDLIVDVDSSLEVNVALLHPEFVSSTRLLGSYLDPGMETMLQFSVTNEGNGPLEWTLQRKLPDGADMDPWAHRLSHNASQITDDSRIEGVVFTNNRFYISGGGNEINNIYVVDRNGELMDMFEQPGDTRYGIYDMTWDGELLWGGDNGRMVYGFTTDGELVASWEGPERINQAITWDSERELLWIAAVTSEQITACDVQGQPQIRVSQFDFRIYGLAYWPDDPDGYPLYVMHSSDENAAIVHKIDIENEDTLFVAFLDHIDGGSPRGIFATNQYDVYSWALMSVVNNANEDRVDLWQIDAHRDWFQVDKRIEDDWESADEEPGFIDVEQTQRFRVMFNSEALADTIYEGYLLFDHYAVDLTDTIWVELDVIGAEAPLEFSLATPADGDTILSNSEVGFTWERSVDRNAGAEVVYRVWFSVGDDSVTTNELPDTTLIIDVSTLELDLSADTTLTWWITASSGEDLTESSERYRLRYMINDLPGDAAIPVEFGLQSVYPSPFNSATTVRFGIDRTEPASLIVYDLHGREIVRLFDRPQASIGNYRLIWDGGQFASGLYILRLQSGSRVQTTKVALIR